MKFPKLKSKAILSPMAGITDIAFRKLATKYGAGLTYTEFVNSTGIIRGKPSSFQALKKDTKPTAVQIFGNNENDLVEAAKYLKDKFEIIDINCGCPAWKVIQTGAGSELLKDPEKIARLVEKLVNAVKKPITVKIRTGIDEKHINAIEVAKLVEKAGAAAIAIHGRTQQQGYSGKANWDIIKKVKETVNIPVIGNGDVFTPEDFKQKLEYSNVDYIMIARGAIGNPYIFKQINDYMKKGTYEKTDNLKIFDEYLKLAEKNKIKFHNIQTQAMNFTKGMYGSTKIRNKISQMKKIEELKEYLETLKNT